MTIKLDVLIVQIINIGILFYIFKKFLGKPLAQEIKRRRNLMDQLHNAQHEYQVMIDQANNEKESIISDALKHKNHLLEQARIAALKIHDDMIIKAEEEGKNLLSHAQVQAKKIEKEVLDHRESNIKHTTQVVVTKLLGNESHLKDAYISQLIKEVGTK